MGARFEALFMGVLTAVSNLGCIFFRILTSGLEQCVMASTLDYLISDSQVIRDSLSHFGKKVNRLTGNKRLSSQIEK